QMTSNPPARPWALVWVALGASLWGVDTLLRRPLTGALASSQIVLIEHLILSAVLWPALWRSWPQWRSLGALQWGAVAGIAWGGSALGTVLFTEAIKIGNPTTAVLLQKIQPLLAALLARFLLAEPLGRRFWACLGVALVAGYLVSFGGHLDAFHHPSSFTPSVLALAAAALWAASTVLGRFALQGLSFTTLTTLRIFAATPFLLVLAGLRSGSLLAPVNSAQAVSLLLMALVPGLAALLVYYYGLRHTRASLAAVAELSFPATATLLNWVFLGARVSAVQIGGFLLLWGVIVYLERRRV
ncbi:MAG: DMT family transporter, partial [Acidobacteria bacterium]|nr:DMT family transporter [Acidobacteriota bacterium]